MRVLWGICVILALLSAPQTVFAQMKEPENVQEPDADDAEPDSAMMGAPVGEDKAVSPAVPNALQEAAPKPPADSGETHFDTVMLQVLNKVTARAQAIEAPIGSVIRYGTIEIIAHKCWKSSPDDRPENAALLEVSEIKQGEKPQSIFSGWMFSSTPGLSSLEHPFYDITVTACGKNAVKP